MNITVGLSLWIIQSPTVRKHLQNNQERNNGSSCCYRALCVKKSSHYPVGNSKENCFYRHFHEPALPSLEAPWHRRLAKSQSALYCIHIQYIAIISVHSGQSSSLILVVWMTNYGGSPVKTFLDQKPPVWKNQAFQFGLLHPITDNEWGALQH